MPKVYKRNRKSKVAEVEVVTITPTPAVLPTTAGEKSYSNSDATNEILAENPANGNQVNEGEALLEDPGSASILPNDSATGTESRKPSVLTCSHLENLGKVPADLTSSKINFSNSPFVKNFLDPVAAQEDFFNILADYRKLLKKKKEGYTSKLEDKSHDDHVQNLPETSHQTLADAIGDDDDTQIIADGYTTTDDGDIQSDAEFIVDGVNSVPSEELNAGKDGSEDQRYYNVDLPGPSHRSSYLRGNEINVKLLEEVFATGLESNSEIETAIPDFISGNDEEATLPVTDNMAIDAERILLKTGYETTKDDGDILSDVEYSIDNINVVSSEELCAVNYGSADEECHVDLPGPPRPSSCVGGKQEKFEMRKEDFVTALESKSWIEATIAVPNIGDDEQIVDSNEINYDGHALFEPEYVIEQVDLVCPETEIRDKDVKHEGNDHKRDNSVEIDQGENLEEKHTEGNVVAKNHSEGRVSELNDRDGNSAVVDDPNIVDRKPVEMIVIKIDPAFLAMYDSMPDL